MKVNVNSSWLIEAADLIHRHRALTRARVVAARFAPGDCRIKLTVTEGDFMPSGREPVSVMLDGPAAVRMLDREIDHIEDEVKKRGIEGR